MSGRIDLWPEDRLGRLIALWATGTSASKIATELGISKNAVVGKANKTPECPPRASPIKRGLGQKIEKLKRPSPPAVVASPIPQKILVTKCRWPIGDVKAKTFRFCDAEVTNAGKPYCEEHCKIAYVKVAA